ncbi:MAG TPA: heme exporter protein CcmB [Acidimicrobiales bacterium]|nr:heme exporter protein CcmB [Acidimicrobiales bacterium]
MWRDAALVAGRDLRVEARSRVTLHQVAPFALLVLVLFAFALDPARQTLERATPGLYWVTVLFSALLAVARSAALDESGGVRDALRLSALEPPGVFAGKALAVAVELLALEALLGLGVVILYGAEPAGAGLLLATCLAATVAVASTGTLYGALVSGLRVRETLLPLLLLPVLAPVLIGATRAFEAALGGVPADGWPWCGLLAVFAILYSVAGAAAYGTLLEGS